MATKLILTIFFIRTCKPTAANSHSFYKAPRGVFSTRPNETQSLTNIKRLGPVGIGIDLLTIAFKMRISHVEKGSPAAKTGKLKAGQITKSINGQQLADIDPRIQLGTILSEAEATDGVLRLAIKCVAEEVIVKIPVLGAYSKTLPRQQTIPKSTNCQNCHGVLKLTISLSPWKQHQMQPASN